MTSSKIFWPDDLSQSQPGKLIGWSWEGGWKCVVAILDEEPLRRAESKGVLPSDMEIFEDVFTSPDAGSETLLGDCRIPPSSESHGLCQFIRSTSSHIVLFTPPLTSRLRHLSLHPISFTNSSITETKELACSGVLGSQEEFERYGSNESSEKDLNDGIQEGGDVNDGLLEEVISKINTIQDVRSALTRLTASDTGLSNAASITATLSPPAPILFDLIASYWRSLSSILLFFCDFPLWTFSVDSDNIQYVIRLSTLSSTVRQIALRAEQGYNLSSKWSSLARATIYAKPSVISDSAATTTTDLRIHSVDYIEFYNTIWLILNDVIIGYTLGAMIRDSQADLTRWLIEGVEKVLIRDLQASLNFLDNWPVGLKLNTPLSNVFCQVFGAMAETAFALIALTFPRLPFLLRITSYASSFGATFLLCIINDCTKLATLHLWLGSVMMGRMYRWNMGGLYSLWNLFRGRRWNVVRLRVDRYDYDNDQVFLGTLLFTILLFLTPTVWAYYVLFATLRIAALAMQFMIETGLAFLNSFPLFALILRLKEPSRLPGGITFTLAGLDSAPYLYLRNKPISFSDVFARFWSLWANLSRLYSPLKLAQGLVKGHL